MKKVYLIIFSLLVSLVLIGCDDAKKGAVYVGNISIETPAQNVTLYVGETFSFAGMKIRAHTGDPAYSYVVDVTESMIDPVDTNEPGVKTVEIRYVVDDRVLTTTFEVTVLAVGITELEIVVPPTKTIYYEGDIFDPSGMMLSVHYNNGHVSTVTSYTYTQTPLTLGTKFVLISYDSHSIGVEIEVLAIEITSLSIETQPIKSTYYEGDIFDSTGMVVKAHFNNGHEEVITEYTVSLLPLMKNTTFILIGYDRFTIGVEIEVIALVISSLSIETPPLKLSYYEGDLFDPTGLEVRVHYNNGHTYLLEDAYTWDIDEPLEVDDNVVKIMFSDMFLKLNITVMAKEIVEIKVHQLPNKTTYVEGELFDPLGLIILAIYNNGDEVIIDYYYYPLEPLTIESSSIIINYLTFTTSFDIVVLFNYSSYPFSPAQEGAFTYIPYVESESIIAGFYITRLYQDNFSGSYVTRVEGNFPYPFMLGADYYILEYLNEEGLWVSFLIDEQSVVLEYNNFDIAINQSYTFRLRVVGGEKDGYVSNIVETGYTGIDTFYTYWGLDESVYISGIMVPYVGRGLEFTFGAQYISEQTDVSEDLSIQWYRVNPVTFELILIEGATESIYYTTEADVGYYLLAKAYGDNIHSGGYLQIISYWGVLKPIEGYVLDLDDEGFTLILNYDVTMLDPEEFIMYNENYEDVSSNFVITKISAGVYEFTGDLSSIGALFIYLENDFMVLVEAEDEHHMMHQGITVIGFEIS